MYIIYKGLKIKIEVVRDVLKALKVVRNRRVKKVGNHCFK